MYQREIRRFRNIIVKVWRLKMRDGWGWGGWEEMRRKDETENGQREINDGTREKL